MRLRNLVLAHVIPCTFAAGCTGPVSKANAELGARVAGSWSARLDVTRPLVFASESASRARTLGGRFAFVAAANGSGPAAFGVYDLDLRLLGLPARGGLPSATLRAMSDDSVEIAFEPANDPVTVVLKGRLAGDSISGVWEVNIPRVTGGGGTFAMVRQQ